MSDDLGELRITGKLASKRLADLKVHQIQAVLKKAGWKLHGKIPPPNKAAPGDGKKAMPKQWESKSFAHALKIRGPGLGIKTLNTFAKAMSNGTTTLAPGYHDRKLHWLADRSAYVVFNPKRKLLITLTRPNAKARAVQPK